MRLRLRFYVRFYVRFASLTADVSIAHVSVRQYTSSYVSIRQHTLKVREKLTCYLRFARVKASYVA